MSKLSIIIFCIHLTNISYEQNTTKIAFGSCSHQDDSLQIFQQIVNQKPDFFVFLGDNIYGDTKDMDSLRERYQRLAKNPNYQQLIRNTKILATWDDHDYGWNDIGKYYECKNTSKEIFLNFFNEPKNSDRWNHEGIYTAQIQEINGKKLQFILLDERTFRSNLKIFDPEHDFYLNRDNRYFYHLDYATIQTTDSTILGQEQWLWLENQLTQQADIRIICSGTQFGIEYNGYESWANFPREKEKMLQIIQKTKANGVVFISGDVHYSEISKIKIPNLYPIYDVTSSGLSETWKFATPNKYRIEGPVMDNNYGSITIDWQNLSIKMEIWDKYQNQRIEYSIPFSEIQF